MTFGGKGAGVHASEVQISFHACEAAQGVGQGCGSMVWLRTGLWLSARLPELACQLTSPDMSWELAIHWTLLYAQVSNRVVSHRS